MTHLTSSIKQRYKQYIMVLFFFSIGILSLPTPSYAVDGCAEASIGTSVFNTLSASTRAGGSQSAGTQQLQDAIKATICQPVPRIKIPGLEFTTAQSIAENTYTDPQNGTTYLFIPFLGEYISAVYRYGIALAGVVAVLILIVSGVQWSMGGSSPDNIDTAKERIKHVLEGLFIIATTYMFLYIINPELTSFKSLKIELQQTKAVSPNEDLTVEASQYSTWAGTVPSNNSTQGSNNIPLFLQYEYRTPYTPCGTIAGQGCAPTSLAMILTGLGFNDATPPAIADMWQATGHRRCPPGNNEADNCAKCETYHSFLREPRFLTKYPVTITSLGNDRAKIIAALQQGTPVMASMSRGRFSSGGHFIVLAGINPDGTILINDPGRNPNIPYCRDHDKNSCREAGRESEQIYPRTHVPADIVFQDIANSYSISRN